MQMRHLLVCSCDKIDLSKKKIIAFLSSFYFVLLLN